MKKLLLFIGLALNSGIAHSTFVEFYMVTTGSNTSSGSTESDNPDVATTNGNWGGSGILGRFIAASGTPFASVSTGSLASIYLDAAANAVFISSVITVVDGTTIDVDTTTIKWGTAPSTGTTGRSCRIGGAWSSLAILNPLFASGTAPLSTRVNVKAGTYANGSTSRSFGMVGTTTKPMWWRGYKTTIGDQDSNYLAEAGTDIPSFTSTTGQFSGAGTGSGYQIYSNLDFTGATTSANGLWAVTSGYSKFYGVRFTNTAANVNARACSLVNPTGAIVVLTRCSMTANPTATEVISNATTYNSFVGCIISSGTNGLQNTSTPCLIKNCIFRYQGGDAIKTSSQLLADSNSIYNPTGNGINMTGVSANGVLITNNYFSSVNQASKSAINNTSGTDSFQITVVGNTYYNCTANVTGVTENFTISDNATLAGEAFTNPSTGDLSLNSYGKGIGYPHYFETISLFQSYMDIGAVQRQEKGSSRVFVQ